MPGLPDIPDIPDIPDPSATESPSRGPAGAPLNIGVFEPQPEPPRREAPDLDPETVTENSLVRLRGSQPKLPTAVASPHEAIEPRSSSPQPSSLQPSPLQPRPPEPPEQADPLRIVGVAVGVMLLIGVVLVVAFGLALVFGLIVGVVAR